MNAETDHTPRPQKPGAKGTKAAGPTREDRLKAALKANMARRKSQAKARSGAQQDKSQGQ